MAVRHSDNTFHVKRAGMTLQSAWKQFGPRTFSSPPAATMQILYPGTGDLFVLAGRSDNNRIYTIEGQLPPYPADQTPTDPIWTQASWEQVVDVDYGSAANPTLAAGPSRIVLGFLKDSVQGPGDIGIYSWSAIPQTPNTTLSGAPRAVYGAGIEGVRMVTIRGYGPATPPNGNARGIACAETFGFPNPFPV